MPFYGALFFMTSSLTFPPSSILWSIGPTLTKELLLLLPSPQLFCVLLPVRVYVERRAVSDATARLAGSLSSTFLPSVPQFRPTVLFSTRSRQTLGYLNSGQRPLLLPFFSLRVSLGVFPPGNTFDFFLYGFFPTPLCL